MWVALPIGFFSAVAMHGDQDDPFPGVTVRARVRQDLENLIECYLSEEGQDFEIIQKPHADYEWRIFMTHEQWGKCMWYASFDVTYHNFKDEVTKVQGKERHDVYLRVWTALRNGLEKIQGRPEPKFGNQPSLLDAHLGKSGQTRPAGKKGKGNGMTQGSWQRRDYHS